jgi:hypothetical protein
LFAAKGINTADIPFHRGTGAAYYAALSPDNDLWPQLRSCSELTFFNTTEQNAKIGGTHSLSLLALARTIHFSGSRQPPSGIEKSGFPEAQGPDFWNKGVFRKVDGHSAQLRGHWANEVWSRLRVDAYPCSIAIPNPPLVSDDSPQTNCITRDNPPYRA